MAPWQHKAWEANSLLWEQVGAMRNSPEVIAVLGEAWGGLSTESQGGGEVVVVEGSPEGKRRLGVACIDFGRSTRSSKHRQLDQGAAILERRWRRQLDRRGGIR